jgi:Tol biopolymer transport system component
VAYATVLHEDGLTSVFSATPEGETHQVRGGLDASPGVNTLAFSPDGRTMYLALASDTIPDLRARHDPEAPGRELDIYAIDLPNGKPRAVVRAPGDDCCPTAADGYLYWTHNAPRPEVVVLPRDGSAAPRVVADHGFLPRWSPDSRQISFTRAYYRLADYGLDMDNWAVGADAGASPAAPQVVGYGEDMGAVWSPDGRWLAYHSHRSRDPVPLYDSQGRTDDIWLRRVGDSTEIRVTDFGWEVGPPAWAPDSRRLLFISWDKGGTPRIAKPWIVTIDPASGRSTGAKRVPLPPGVTSVVDVAWARTGEEIAFNARVDATHQALWVSRADGSGARKIADLASYTYGGIDWTPDGKEVLVGALTGGHMEIFAVPSSGGTPRQLTRDSLNLMQPSVSPDGRFVAATRLLWRKELRRTKLSALTGRKPSAY